MGIYGSIDPYSAKSLLEKRVIDLEGNSIRVGHVYNADKGLRKTRARIARIKGGEDLIVNANCIGDSITENYQTGLTDVAAMISNGYVGRLRTMAANILGDVGRGFFPYYYPTNGGTRLITFTGAWADQSSSWGVAGVNKTTSTNGASFTVEFDGTGIALAFIRGPVTGTFTVSIDGGAAQSFDTYNAGGVLDTPGIYTKTGLTDGTHTAVITSTVTTGRSLFFIGWYEIKGTKGMRFNTMGKYGTVVNAHVGSTTAAGNQTMGTTVDMWDSNTLFMYSLLANDYYNGGVQTPLDTYEAKTKIFLDRVKNKGCECIVTSIGIRADAGTIPQYKYVEILKKLALERDFVFVDIFNKWGGDAITVRDTYGLLSDWVHPNNGGQYDIAETIASVLF